MIKKNTFSLSTIFFEYIYVYVCDQYVCMCVLSSYYIFIRDNLYNEYKSNDLISDTRLIYFSINLNKTSFFSI